MKRRQVALWILTLMVLVACGERTAEYVTPVPEVVINMGSLSGEQVQPGQLIVKFKSEPVSEDIATRANSIGVYRMERIFPPAGRFEERSRAEGLHLWYVIEYDENIPATRAAEAISFWDDVRVVEPVIPVRRSSSATYRRRLNQQDVIELNCSNSESSFNDPFLGLQWNYNNTGNMNHGEVGADIRLYGAWETATGSPEVIVAIIDGGIDYTHVDLSANMWVNESELNGVENEDDDGNGYKDDIYGYNFVTGKAVEPTLHGTHVAGTIGAVNNNGIGVSGIAGGNGTAYSGVRLMSCQIFIDNEQGEQSATNYYTAAAIKYAADNGAVICQNSWSFDMGAVSSTPTVIQEAIDYFISKAGVDEGGSQEGPMKGGLVVFAAGNDNSFHPTYPTFDNDVISVAAMGPDYVKATYSNYNTIVDLIAPGGELSYDPVRARTGILSTGAGWDGSMVAKNAYYYMDGTSMACPHVSGVAALVVSHFGVSTPGLTPAQVKESLYNSTYDIYKYNSTYQGLLGVGALDAAASLTSGVVTPDFPVLLKAIPNQTFTRIGASRTIDLSDYFALSGSEDDLAYRISVVTAGVMDYQLTGDVLEISSTAYGRTYVIVAAIRNDGLEVSTTFLLSCYSKSVSPTDDRSGFWHDIGDGELH